MTETPSTPETAQEQEPGKFRAWLNEALALRATDVLWYRVCDDLSGLVILPMLVFSPWAFGTAQRWSINIMTAGGFVLGALLLVKLFIRIGKGYPALRWDQSARSGPHSRRRRALRWLMRALVLLNFAALAECLVSAWNAAADYKAQTRVFEYHQYISWLPHSLDGARTWSSLWMYLGLAGAFWAIRDWLAGMTAAEERRPASRNPLDRGTAPTGRLRLMLWVLCISGCAMGIEAIVQRASGTNKLLFLVVPTVHIQGETQFGPYAYRSNAAQYFNMLWPICLGFWLTLQRTSSRRSWSHHWLLPCAMVMAACPIISTSRAGALVSVGLMLLIFIYLGVSSLLNAPAPTAQASAPSASTNSGANGNAESAKPAEMPKPAASGQARAEGAGRHRRASAPESDASQTTGRSGGRGTAACLVLFLVVSLGLGWYYGWDALFPRLQGIEGGYEEREDMYAAALPMAADYPWFGTGAGTFGTVFQLYRFSDEVFWAEQLHNDWLETRITFGWVGLGLLLATLAGVWLRWFFPGGMRVHRRLVVLAWLSLGGCLLTARFDFPFQLHSTLFLFLVICAMLLNASRNPGSARA